MQIRPSSVIGKAEGALAKGLAVWGKGKRGWMRHYINCESIQNMSYMYKKHQIMHPKFSKYVELIQRSRQGIQNSFIIYILNLSVTGQ